MPWLSAWPRVAPVTLLTLVLCVAPAHSANRHAAPSDQGAGNCNAGNNCDLQQALGAAQPGDMVFLSCGTYRGLFSTTRHGTAGAGRITVAPETPYCAKIEAPTGASVGNGVLIANRHSNWTFQYLDFDAKKTVRSIFEHNRGGGTTTGLIFEWNRLKDADSACIGSAKDPGDVVNNAKVRFNYIDGCGWGANGEAIYFGSVEAPRVEAEIYGNIMTRFTHNSMDFKPQGGGGNVINVHHNIAQEQVWRANRATKDSLEDGMTMRTNNGIFVYNIFRNFVDTANPAHRATSVYSISPNRNILVNNNVAMDIRNTKEFVHGIRDPGTIGQTVVTSNTLCNLRSYVNDVTGGVTVSGNIGQSSGAIPTDCSSKVGEILLAQRELLAVDPTAAPLTFVAGTVSGNQVNMTLRTNGHTLFVPPSNGCTAAISCIKNDVAWADTGCAISGTTNVLLTMTGSWLPGEPVYCTYTRGTAGPIYTSSPTEMAAGTYTIVPDDGTGDNSLVLADAYINTPANVVHFVLNTHGHTLSTDGDTCTTGLACTKEGVAWTDTSCVKVGTNGVDLTLTGNAVALDDVVCTYTPGTADPITSSAPTELVGFTTTVRNELGGGGTPTYTQHHCRVEEPGYTQREWMNEEDAVFNVPAGGIFIVRCAIGVSVFDASGASFSWWASDSGGAYYEISSTSSRISFAQDASGKRKAGELLLKGLTEDLGKSFVSGGTLVDSSVFGGNALAVENGGQIEIAAVLQLAPTATLTQSSAIRVRTAAGAEITYVVTPTIVTEEIWAAN